MTAGSAPREKPTPPRPPVAVKGGAGGLRIVVSRAASKSLETSLREQLERRAEGFFAGAGVVLELPPGPLDMALAARLAAVIEAGGMRLERIEAGGAAASVVAAAGQPAPQAVPAEAALVVTRNLRSGQRVAHDGTVVVLGDVNPGAEVLAGGSVMVWGRLRGTVEAGLSQPEGAVVCALDLAPTQLRIGPALARAPDEPGRTPVPEVAREVDGQIVVDAWTQADGRQS